MRRFIVTFSAILAAALPAFATAAATAPQAPLRHLVYTTQYSIASKRTQRTSGLGVLDPNPDHGTAIGTTGASNSSSTAVKNAGTLTIDVIAFDKSGALVVDASLVGDHRSQAPIRVAILADGRLGVDPRTDLCDEARRLLPLFAGSFVGGHDLAADATWSVATGGPPAGSMTVHVTDVTDDRARLEIDSDVHAGGLANAQETSHAKAVYAVKLLAPVSYDVAAHIRRTPDPGVEESAEVHLGATLVTDSFGSRV
jgi:hypothetical protein